MATRLRRVLAQGKATAWPVVVSVWTIRLCVPLDAKLPEPGEGLWKLALKWQGVTITAEFFCPQPVLMSEVHHPLQGLSRLRFSALSP